MGEEIVVGVVIGCIVTAFFVGFGTGHADGYKKRTDEKDQEITRLNWELKKEQESHRQHLERYATHFEEVCCDLAKLKDS